MVWPMRTLAATLLLAAMTGCASEPPGPTLPMPLTFKQNEYEEAGGILPVRGMLELVIEPTGQAKSACRRDILTDVERRGDLTREQLVELVTRVEAWSQKAGDMPGSGKNFAFLVYGNKKAGWQKDASLPPELDALVKFLLTIPPTLRVHQARR